MRYHWRQDFIFAILFIFSLLILGQLFSLQVLKGDYYKALSQGLQMPFNESQPDRGEIFLKNGEPLAINVDFPFVFVSSKKIKDFEETAKALSEVLALDKAFVQDRLKTAGDYSVVKKELSQKEVEALKNLNLEGVSLNEERGRYYPQEELASQVTGFLGAEKTGQYGLEGAYEEALNGEEELRGVKKGADLTLTIDYNAQFEAEKLLKKAKENLDIEDGQIIVMEPDTGRIIALANFPNFNPNQYEKYAKEGNLAIFQNKATDGLFEPGSVFKSFTMAAALEEGKITPQTTYKDEGSLKIGGYTVYNYDRRVYGEQTMTNVLEKSINTGAVFAERSIGPKTFLDYLERLGIFEPSGIDVPEVYSENKEFKKGYEINFVTASFGQGIEMTPIQLARGYCAIANEGKLVTPYLVEKILENGKEIKAQNENEKQIFSSKTASQLTTMLVSVVENGFGKAAKIPGYFIAGKTGTAQVSFSSLRIQKSGYSDKTIQSFVGWPAFNSKFLILVKLNNPQTKTAEYSAVPVFRELAEYLIHYYQIPPDYAP